MEIPAMKWSMFSLAAAVILLLLADLLAFHDLFEPHTVRDWLMLAATALVVVGIVGGSAEKLGTLWRRG
jgi:hypothetical protein